VAPTIDQRQLGAELRNLRRQAGLSGKALGAILGSSQASISRAEMGQRLVSPDEITRWTQAAGADPDETERLLRLGRAARAQLRSWWDVHAGGLARRQQEVAGLEAASTRICNYQLVIPGLLQTADYARRALTLADVSGQEGIAAAVAARMHRQEVLYDQAKLFDYVLPESALRWRLADDAGMRAQADRLVSIDSLPNVTLGILPLVTAPPSLPSAGFVIYERPDDPLVLIETLTSELLFGGEREVSAYRDAFARMLATAVTGTAAHELIRDTMSLR
jgi:transcriptional regulator with XRE-family HTH domain